MRLRLLVVVLVVMLAACQTTRGVRKVSKPVARSPVTQSLPATPAEKAAAIVTTPIPAPGEMPEAPVPVQPDTSLLATYPQTAESISGPAVISLLKKASNARAAGKPEQASAALERALRIEPRNYFVWSALAATYLQSKDYEQAESVAKKSNSLARGNVYVEQENWRVIHEVRIALGDADGAVQAQSHVDAIQQLLSEVPASVPAPSQ